MSSLLFETKLYAHVTLTYPKGGETFTVDEKIIIKWDEVVDHGPNNLDLYFSVDSGINWEIIKENIEESQTEYEWTIPDSLTQFARIKVVQDNVGGGTDYDDASGNFTITASATGVNEATALPESFTLFQNYPNPFNPSTIISYNISRASFVKLRIYNLEGQEIKTLVSEMQAPGNYKITWNGLNENKERVISGVYFYKLSTQDFSLSKKMLLIK